MQNDGMKYTQSERIELALKAADMSARDVAESMGITVQAVYNWLRNPAANLKSEHLFRLASLTKHSPRWIALEEGPRKIGDLAANEPEVAYALTTEAAARPNARAVIAAVQSMLALARLPRDCLGTEEDLRQAILGVAPKKFTLARVREAAVELLTESRQAQTHLTANQIAELLTIKLDNWIEIQSGDKDSEIAQQSKDNGYIRNV